MSTKDRKNIVASVLAKLRNTSKSSGALFQQVLQQYAMERFLYRISKSKHAQSVVLKGALLLKTIGIPHARPTMDIDMLRTGKADQASLLALVKNCATLDVPADGIYWICSTHLDLNGKTMLKAIDATFKNRQTPVPAEEFEALSPAFVQAHHIQWNAFVKKMGEEHLADSFGKVVEEPIIFAMPVLRALTSGENLTQKWQAGAGWVSLWVRPV